MSDEPTNIIRHPKPAAKSDKAGHGSAGTIRFSCSNGHAIAVPAKLAGKRGSCSRCGVAVVIPLSSDQAPPVAEEVPAAAGHGETAEEVGGTVTEAAIESAPEAATESRESPDFSGFGQDGAAAEPPPDAFEGLAASESRPGPPAFDGIEPAAVPEMDGIDNPTAVLVAKLFGETEHGGVVELHLKSGQIVIPLLYDFNWSRGTHGVFAAENKSDGTITLMAVAWDSVEQVIIRKVKGLPDGMFE